MAIFGKRVIIMLEKRKILAKNPLEGLFGKSSLEGGLFGKSSLGEGLFGKNKDSYIWIGAIWFWPGAIWSGAIWTAKSLTVQTVYCPCRTKMMTFQKL